MPENKDKDTNTDNTNDKQSNTTWESILEGLPDEAKALYEGHTSGLKSALQKERDARSDQERQLRELAKSADKGSELETRITAQADEIAEANKRADFYEEAAKPENGCRNPKLAYMVAQSDKLFDRRGAVNWEAIKKSYPELFGKSITKSANAADGRDDGQEATSIDDRLRKRAGY